MAERPNPGSDEALDQGCICAVLDNCHGKFAPWPPDGWWITQGCPVHAAIDAVPSDAVPSLTPPPGPVARDRA